MDGPDQRPDEQGRVAGQAACQLLRRCPLYMWLLLTAPSAAVPVSRWASGEALANDPRVVTGERSMGTLRAVSSERYRAGPGKPIIGQVGRGRRAAERWRLEQSRKRGVPYPRSERPRWRPKESRRK